MGQNEKIALAILLVVAILSGTISAYTLYKGSTTVTPADGGVFAEGIIGQAKFINPLLATTENDLALTHLIFSGLYKYDGDGNIVPDLAEELPTIDDTQKIYTIKLKQNAFWHNGNKLTADDVVYTIQTLQNPLYESPKRSDWLSTEVQKIDDYTVQFNLKDISGPFIHNLTLPIISQAIWSQVPAEKFTLTANNLEAVGTGPYQIEEITKLPQGEIQSIRLKSHPTYHLGKPKIEIVKVIFYSDSTELLNALHGRQISGLGFLPQDQNLYLDPNNSKIQQYKLPLPQYQAVFFNLNNPVLGQNAVRNALNSATDKTQIVEQVYKGNARPIDSPILEEQVKGSGVPENLTSNIELANQILDQAGWQKNSQTGIRQKLGQNLKFTLTTNDSAFNRTIAENLASEWLKLGVEVNIQALNSEALNEQVIQGRKYEMLLFAHKLGADPDPFVFWHSSQTKNPGLNITGYNNLRADKLISEARSTTDPEVRRQKYVELQQVMRNDIPAIFLTQSLYVYAINSDVKGINTDQLFDPTYRWSDINNWYINTTRTFKR